MNRRKNNQGFTLLELIVVLALLGGIITSLQLVLGQSLASHRQTREKLETVSRARFVMDRLVMLITETAYIETPGEGGSSDSLVIEERLMDAHNNSNNSYAQNGDGIWDADNDSNGVVNDNDAIDPIDKITISLDKTDAQNWKLVEVLPNYGTADFYDTMAKRILCENVRSFVVTRGSSNKKKLIKINLELGKDAHVVTLVTRATAEKMLIL